jgi:hypothetical protein
MLLVIGRWRCSCRPAFSAPALPAPLTAFGDARLWVSREPELESESESECASESMTAFDLRTVKFDRFKIEWCCTYPEFTTLVLEPPPRLE